MKKIILIATAFMLSACASTATKNDKISEENSVPSSLEEYCASNRCREDHILKFRTKNRDVEQWLQWYFPVVQEDRLSLLPGDKVYIEAEIIDGKFSDLKQVETPLNPSKTITLEFRQVEDKIDMMLSVNNPFDKSMKFHIDMIDFEGKPHQTSSCPVMAGKLLFEHWPHVIPEIIISNIRAVDLSDSLTCVY